MPALRSAVLLALLLALGGVGHAQLFPDTSGFAVFSNYQIKLNDGVDLSNEAVGSNEKVTVAGHVIVDTVIADEVRIGAGTQVSLVEANELGLRGTPPPVVTTFLTPVEEFVAPMPTPPTVAAPTLPGANVATAANVVLTPGSYAFIHIAAGATVSLTPGEYDVGDIVVRGGRTTGGELVCDRGSTPDPVPCVVRVQTKLNLAGAGIGGQSAKPSVPDGGPLHIEFAGTAGASVGSPGVTVVADVIAPLSVVRMKSSKGFHSSFEGHYVGSSVIVGAGATVRTPAP